MPDSRTPGPTNPDPFSIFLPARTPGSLGVNDAVDPNAHAHTGGAPVPVGVRHFPVLPVSNTEVNSQTAKGNADAETWFRGEGAGVTPSAPGKNLHDFGDGLYLTDTEDVAWQYAHTRAQGEYKNYKVFTAQIARSTLGNVLDLTTDRRWAEFMNHPDPMLLGKNRLYYVKQQNELYGQFFTEFLKVNKISRSSFDAVIGPEYVRGGKQICVVSPKGAERVRALLQPEPWAARLASSQAGPRSRTATLESEPLPRTNIGVWGAVALTLGTVALVGLVSYLNQKMTDKWNDKMLQRKLKELQPEIENYIAARERMILDIALETIPVYVVVTLCLTFSSTALPPEASPGDVEYGSSVLIGVQIDSLGTSSRKLEGDIRNYPKSLHPKINWTSRMDFDGYNISYPVTPSKEDTKSYRDFAEQFKWYDETIKNPALLSSDVARLKKNRNELADLIDQIFSPVREFKPNPAFWTDDGLAQMTGTK